MYKVMSTLVVSPAIITKSIDIVSSLNSYVNRIITQLALRSTSFYRSNFYHPFESVFLAHAIHSFKSVSIIKIKQIGCRIFSNLTDMRYRHISHSQDAFLK